MRKSPMVLGTTFRKALGRRLVIVAALSFLMSCVVANLATNIKQEKDIDQLTNWMLVTELRRLSTTDIGRALRANEGQNISVDLSGIHAADRKTKGKAASAELVPVGSGWEVLRSIAARQSPKTKSKRCSRYIRSASVEKGGERLTFDHVPDGEYDMFVKLRLSPGSLFMHGKVSVVDGEAACTDIRVITSASEFYLGLE